MIRTQSFGIAGVSAMPLGAPVALTDGRQGYIVGRCFGVTPGGAPRLEHYSVMLTGGKGRVSAKPAQVNRSAA